MTKKIVLLACIATLAISASAQTGTLSVFKTAPKSHAVGSQIKAPGSFDMTKKIGPKAVKGVSSTAPKSTRIGRK